MESKMNLAKPLLDWYDSNARVLPWREDPTPYRVWISEIMLQQTRVEAVKPYFERFIKELPSILDLSSVDDERLLKLWEGLGYYNRARNLKKAARQIVDQLNGEMPSTLEGLMMLPGIGSYTAGAIASIAFEVPVPAVDGNVLRVMTRVMGNTQDISDVRVKTYFERELKDRMSVERPGAFNQALMELGAMVCIPNGQPKCTLCPFQEFCEAKLQDKIAEIPRKTPKKPRVLEDKTVLIIRDENKVVLRKRKNKGLLAGMYEFPNLEGHLSSDEVVNYLKELGYGILKITPLSLAKHIFTHREWRMIGYLIRVDELEPNPNAAAIDFLLIDPKETQKKYPIPAAFSAYTGFLNIRLGQENFIEGK
ncbi:MAG: A/G-specific adenine glycosylase [Clostridiales bacterium]|nr:A/G-specific adenine glycosylase [Clostridiales bacterium]